eukprot:6919014-Karenia_brevis.AAC.1
MSFEKARKNCTKLNVHFVLTLRGVGTLFGRLWDFIFGASWPYGQPGSPSKRVSKKTLQEKTLEKRGNRDGVMARWCSVVRWAALKSDAVKGSRTL